MNTIRKLEKIIIIKSREKHEMKPSDLILHCYAEKKDTLWIACCLDFTLAVQGNSLAEVKFKLEEVINEYLQDVLVGEFKENAAYFLKRKAPLSEWIKYYYIVCFSKLTKNYQLIKETVSLVPKKYKNA